MELINILERWNSDLVKDPGIADVVETAVLAHHWLGVQPASQAAISAAEVRLGATLPPSYKSFLLISNGWVYPGNEMDFPGALRPIEAVGWFRDEDSAWIDAWVAAGEEYSIPDADYLNYGEEQDTAMIRVEYLPGCLKISEVTEGGVYLLNPAILSQDGEWEAWHFSNELPGAHRAPSFSALLVQQHALFRHYRD